MKLPERKGATDPFGLNRVLDAKATLPQAADKLDNTLPIYPNEILIDVEMLNIDAASFVQMEGYTDLDGIGKILLDNTRTQGKQQNRVTGSGGMLVGIVKQVGSKYKGPLKVKAGDRIATLVSLTLTPLHLESVEDINPKTHQVKVKGHAILFETGIGAKLPKDIPDKISMAAMDVAGAPATVYGHLKKGQTLVVIGGGGKAGILSCVAGRQKLGKSGKIIAIEPFAKAADELRALKVCDQVLQIDATSPIEVRSGIEKATRGKMADVVINVASVPGTEVSALLSSKQSGKIIFFSMATSFSKVTLGAEGIASSATLIFGNGYYPKHASFVMSLLQKHKALRQLFDSRYS